MDSTELVYVTQRRSDTSTHMTEPREATILRTVATAGGLEDARRMQQGLAPVDGGFAAWRLLCAAFMFEALLWGELQPYTSSNYRC